MEIVITIIVAVCILLAWGPRVLLAIIVVPPMLFFVALFANDAREQTKLAAKPAITKTACTSDAEWIYCPPVRP